MLGASHFVNVVLFQFSGPDNFSPAQPLLRSFSCDSDALSFSFVPLGGHHFDFYSVREKALASHASIPSNGAANQ